MSGLSAFRGSADAPHLNRHRQSEPKPTAEPSAAPYRVVAAKTCPGTEATRTRFRGCAPHLNHRNANDSRTEPYPRDVAAIVPDPTTRVLS